MTAIANSIGSKDIPLLDTLAKNVAESDGAQTLKSMYNLYNNPLDWALERIASGSASLASRGLYNLSSFVPKLIWNTASIVVSPLISFSETTEAVARETGKIFAALNNSMVSKIMPTVEGNAAVSFNLTDLIGPSLLIGLCSYKSTENITSAFEHFKLIISGEREKIFNFKTEFKNIPAHRIEHYTLAGLTADIVMEGIFAGIWAGVGYLTTQGITDALIASNVPQAQAKTISTVIAVLSAAAPILINKLKPASLEFSPYSSFNFEPAEGWAMTPSTIHWESDKQDFEMDLIVDPNVSSDTMSLTESSDDISLTFRQDSEVLDQEIEQDEKPQKSSTDEDDNFNDIINWRPDSSLTISDR